MKGFACLLFGSRKQNKSLKANETQMPKRREPSFHFNLSSKREEKENKEK